MGVAIGTGRERSTTKGAPLDSFHGSPKSAGLEVGFFRKGRGAARRVGAGKRRVKEKSWYHGSDDTNFCIGVTGKEDALGEVGHFLAATGENGGFAGCKLLKGRTVGHEDFERAGDRGRLLGKPILSLLEAPIGPS
jgi:hypothetical protein